MNKQALLDFATEHALLVAAREHHGYDCKHAEWLNEECREHIKKLATEWWQMIQRELKQGRAWFQKV